MEDYYFRIYKNKNQKFKFELTFFSEVLSNRKEYENQKECIEAGIKFIDMLTEIIEVIKPNYKKYD